LMLVQKSIHYLLVQIRSEKGTPFFLDDSYIFHQKFKPLVFKIRLQAKTKCHNTNSNFFFLS
jgi:hypothetical protein